MAETRAKKKPAKRATKKKGPRGWHSASIISAPFFFADLDAKVLRVTFEITTSDTFFSPNGEVVSTESETVTQETTVPLVFKDEAQCRDWANRVRKSYHETLSYALMGEAAAHLTLVMNALLNDLGIVKIDLPALIDETADRRARRAKTGLGLPLKGRYSQWTPTELTLAVRGVLKSMSAHEKKDYENVAQKLCQLYPDKAPKTGGALRKLMSRLDVNWKKLKSGQ